MTNRCKKLILAVVDGVATVQRSYGVTCLSFDNAVSEIQACESVYITGDRTGYDLLDHVLSDITKDVYWFDLKAFNGMRPELLCHAMTFVSHRYSQPSAMVRMKDDFREFLRSAIHCRVKEDELTSVLSGEYSGGDKFHAFVEDVANDLGVKKVSGKKCLVELLLKLGHPNWTTMQESKDADIVVRRLKIHVDAASFLKSVDVVSDVSHPRQYVIGLYRSTLSEVRDLTQKDVNAMRRMVAQIFKLYRRKFGE